MRKNREETERAILDAVTGLVAESGFSAVGVNAVAERAGVSKVLIYRYFGGFDQLIERWALGRNFWVSASADAQRLIDRARGDRSALVDALFSLLAAETAALRADRVSRETLRWFLSAAEELPGKIMAGIEGRGAKAASAFAEALGEAGGPPGKDIDFEALSAVAVAGVYYLALIADRAPVFNGVPLDSDEGWERIRGALRLFAESALGADGKR